MNIKSECRRVVTLIKGFIAPLCIKPHQLLQKQHRNNVDNKKGIFSSFLIVGKVTLLFEFTFYLAVYAF